MKETHASTFLSRAFDASERMRWRRSMLWVKFAIVAVHAGGLPPPLI
jgi:hypothetical protein